MGHAELSAVAEHVHQTGHQIYWEPRVIAKKPRYMERKITEAIAINKLGKDKVMNQDCGLDVSKLFLDITKPRTKK